jgi:hypothetical protein
MTSPLAPGQGVRHADYGIGIAVRSDDSRTTIDFHEHGRKTFVTSMLRVDLVADVPKRPPTRRAKKADS